MNAPLEPADKRYRFGYVTLTALLPPFTKKDEIEAFNGHHNEQNADIQFIKEIKENEPRTTRYPKPTHTDRLIGESTPHKATTTKTLTRRAQLVCDTLDS